MRFLSTFIFSAQLQRHLSFFLLAQNDKVTKPQKITVSLPQSSLESFPNGFDIQICMLGICFSLLQPQNEVKSGESEPEH